MHCQQNCSESEAAYRKFGLRCLGNSMTPMHGCRVNLTRSKVSDMTIDFSQISSPCGLKLISKRLIISKIRMLSRQNRARFPSLNMNKSPRDTSRRETQSHVFLNTTKLSWKISTPKRGQDFPQRNADFQDRDAQPAEPCELPFLKDEQLSKRNLPT